MSGYRVRRLWVRARTVDGAMSQSAAASSRSWRIMWMRIRGRGQRKPWTIQVGIVAVSAVDASV